MGYKDRTWCCSRTKVHTCGREFTIDDHKDATRWWGNEDYPLSVSKFCEEEDDVLCVGREPEASA